MADISTDLAQKRPATVVSVSTSPKTIDGKYRAVRGGPTGRGVLTVFALLLLAALLAGFLLSMLQQAA